MLNALFSGHKITDNFLNDKTFGQIFAILLIIFSKEGVYHPKKGLKGVVNGWKLVAHGAEELVVVAGAFHTVFDELHGFDGGAVGEETAENPHAIEGLGAQQQVVAAGAGSHDVDGGEDALVGECAVELELHVAGAFELFEDDFVHFG